ATTATIAGSVTRLPAHIAESRPRERQPRTGASGMSSTHIDAAEISAGLPAELRPYWNVESIPIPRDKDSGVRALWEAAKILLPVIRVIDRVMIVVSPSPFQINLGTGQLVYSPRADVLSSCVERIVFLDVGRMLPYKYPAQVAIALEELVHVVLNIKDDRLVR